MKASDCMALALRVLAVFLLARFLGDIVQSAVFWLSPGARMNWSITPLSSLLLLFPFALSILIWLVAPRLGRLAARGMPQTPVARLDASDIVSAAFVAVGVWISLTSLAALVGLGAQLFARLHHGGAIPVSASLIGALATAALRFLFGVFLVFGCRGLARLLLKLRYAGTSGTYHDIDSARE